MSDPTLAAPPPTNPDKARVAQARADLDAALEATLRGIKLDSPELRALLANTISLNGSRSHRAVMAEKRAGEIADDVLDALRKVGVTFLLAPAGGRP